MRRPVLQDATLDAHPLTANRETAIRSPGFTLIHTAIGACGLAWSGDERIIGLLLPEASTEATAARLARRFPRAIQSSPPAALHPVIDGVIALLAGEKVDLSDAPLDLDRTPPFHRRVYELVRRIPPGETLTYGQVAERLGEPREAARAVGEAMGRNPFPILMPCHRVLAANGRPGGFSAPGGVETKLRMLVIEGARIGDAPTLFDDLPPAVRPGR